MEVCYPLFLQPGKLRALNELAFREVGFPLFLYVSERSRPAAEDVVGVLYEVVTGLYVVYHDYGSRFLNEFCAFCDGQDRVEPLRDQYREERKQDRTHQDTVNKIRSGFCHGIFPDTRSGMNYVLALQDLTGISGSVSWPDFPANLNKSQCAQVLENLLLGADNLYKHLWQDIESLAARDGVMEQFRNRLQTKLLNSDQPQWGFAKKKEYFDLRVIKQVCGRARDLPVPNTLIVRCWLKMLVDGLRRGEIENASAPIVRLQELCYQVKHEGLVIRLAEARWSQTATRSSSTILGADLEF